MDYLEAMNQAWAIAQELDNYLQKAHAVAEPVAAEILLSEMIVKVARIRQKLHRLAIEEPKKG